MRISDAIAAYILHRIDEAGDGSAELRRNELAEELGCVPSQINYVITSRFTPEQGYIVESRRGGGGYIRIHRVQYTPGCSPLMHVVNSIGETLVPAAAQAILDSLAGEMDFSSSRPPDWRRFVGPGVSGCPGGMPGPAAGKIDETDAHRFEYVGYRRKDDALSKLWQETGDNFLKKTINGETTEIHLCADCAGQQGLSMWNGLWL